jgi:hypothetical protein
MGQRVSGGSNHEIEQSFDVKRKADIEWGDRNRLDFERII